MEYYYHLIPDCIEDTIIFFSYVSLYHVSSTNPSFKNIILKTTILPSYVFPNHRCKNIRILSCHKDIETLTNFKRLNCISLCQNIQIKSLSCLTELISLNLDKNTNIIDLYTLTYLRHLNTGKYTSIKINHFILLKSLNIHCTFASNEFHQLTNLIRLSIHNIKSYDIDLNHLINLKILYLNDAEINNSNINNLTQLEYIHLGRNLTPITHVNSKNLTFLFMNKAQFDISNLYNLKILYIHDSSKLNFSNLTKLEKLYTFQSTTKSLIMKPIKIAEYIYWNSYETYQKTDINIEEELIDCEKEKPLCQQLISKEFYTKQKLYVICYCSIVWISCIVLFALLTYIMVKYMVH